MIKVTWAEKLERGFYGRGRERGPEEETVLLKASDTDVCVLPDAGLVFSAIT